MPGTLKLASKGFQVPQARRAPESPGGEGESSRLHTRMNQYIIDSPTTSKTGPRTPEGKAVSRMNALKHGIRCERPVVPGEKAEEWERHRDAITTAIQPKNALEEALAQRAALLLWRLGRVQRYEVGKIKDGIHDADNRGITDSPKFMRALLEENRTALTTLNHLDSEGSVPGEAAFHTLIAVGDHLGLDLDDFPPDDLGTHLGMSADPEDLFDSPDWTYSHLREAIRYVCNDEDPAKIIRCTIKNLRCSIRRTEDDLKTARRHHRLKIQTHTLPSATTLENTAKYESHLSRQLTSTLALLAGLRGIHSFGKKQVPVPALEDHQ